MTSLGRVRTWWRSLDPRVLDATVAVLLLVVTVIPLATRSLVAGQRPSDIWAYLLAVALCVPFVFHRRFPVAAITVACCALVLYAVGRYNAYPGLPIFVLVAGISLHSTRRKALLAAGLAAVALSVAVWLQPERVATASTWVASLLAVAVAWLGARTCATAAPAGRRWRSGPGGWRPSGRSATGRRSPPSGCASHGNCTTWWPTR